MPVMGLWSDGDHFFFVKFNTDLVMMPSYRIVSIHVTLLMPWHQRRPSVGTLLMHLCQISLHFFFILLQRSYTVREVHGEELACPVPVDVLKLTWCKSSQTAGFTDSQTTDSAAPETTGFTDSQTTGSASLQTAGSAVPQTAEASPSPASIETVSDSSLQSRCSSPVLTEEFSLGNAYSHVPAFPTDSTGINNRFQYNSIATGMPLRITPTMAENMGVGINGNMPQSMAQTMPPSLTATMAGNMAGIIPASMTGGAIPPTIPGNMSGNAPEHDWKHSRKQLHDLWLSSTFLWHILKVNQGPLWSSGLLIHYSFFFALMCSISLLHTICKKKCQVCSLIIAWILMWSHLKTFA